MLAYVLVRSSETIRQLPDFKVLLFFPFNSLLFHLMTSNVIQKLAVESFLLQVSVSFFMYDLRHDMSFSSIETASQIYLLLLLLYQLLSILIRFILYICSIPWRMCQTRLHLDVCASPTSPSTSAPPFRAVRSSKVLELPKKRTVSCLLLESIPYYTYICNVQFVNL